MYACTHVCTGWMDGWMDRWMDGWIYIYTYIYIYIHIYIYYTCVYIYIYNSIDTISIYINIYINRNTWVKFCIGSPQIAYPKLIEKYVGGELVVLGTDGFGAPSDSAVWDGFERRFV
jgi:hypothetical protein